MEWVYAEDYTITRKEMLKSYIVHEIEMGTNPFWDQIFNEINLNVNNGKFKIKFKAKDLKGFKEFISKYYEEENKDNQVLLFAILKNHFVNVIKGLGYDIEMKTSLQRVPGFSMHYNNESLDEIDKIEFEINLI